MNTVEMISVVIPVRNEEESLRGLTESVLRVMEGLGRKYEVIFVDDGSEDGSLAVLKELAATPEVLAVELARNAGQHAAVLAGMSMARGDAVITMDADMQNPPEEIPKLIGAMEKGGHDVVGGKRLNRKDPVFRLLLSWAANAGARVLTRRRISDWGCMMRAYRRDVAEAMVSCRERSVYVPALACRFARDMAEIGIVHRGRSRGRSNYTAAGLARLGWAFFLSISGAGARGGAPPFVIKEIHSSMSSGGGK